MNYSATANERKRTIFEYIVHCDSNERNGNTLNTMQHVTATVTQSLQRTLSNSTI